MIKTDATTLPFQPDDCRMVTKHLRLSGGFAPMRLPFPADILVDDLRADPMQLVPSVALGLQLGWGFPFICHLNVSLSIANSGPDAGPHESVVGRRLQNQLVGAVSGLVVDKFVANEKA